MSANLVAVTVVGEDRPGIVAAITEALFRAGCNLQDVTSTILRGHFAMMLLVAAPDGAEPAALEEELADAGRSLGLVVTVRHVDEVEHEIVLPTHIVSVYGADQPGIVYHVARALSELGANITDLTSRMIGSDEEPVYAIALDVATDDETALERALDGVRSELKVEITTHPVEADVL